MANLNGQNIGTNYKGILNLNTLNGNLSGTLQAVTDGDGNASPLQLSTSTFRFQRSDANTQPYMEVIAPSIWDLIINLRGFNDTSGCWSIQATDRLILGRNPSFGGFDSTISISQFGSYFGSSAGYASARVHVRGASGTDVGYFETSAIGEIATIGVGGGGTSRFLGAIRADVLNDYANGYTLVQYLSATQIRFGGDSLRLNPTTLEAIFNGTIRAASLPTTRPATVGDLYQDTAANILANNDKVVGIRV